MHLRRGVAPAARISDGDGKANNGPDHSMTDKRPDARPPASRRLVTTEWLQSHLDDPNVSVVDGSFYLPTMNRDPRAEFLAEHIPGAVFFDIDGIADHATALPHMLPRAEEFAKAVGALGIGRDDTIVVYDTGALSGSPRVWWTFRLFGAGKVFILDGGLSKWKAEGRPIEAGEPKRVPRRFDAVVNAAEVAGVPEMQQTIARKSAQIVDARSAARFRGEAAEPRAGLSSGHIPGSFNVPSAALTEDSRLIAPEKIVQAFVRAGVDLDKPIITTCGSGVTAATLWFALDAIGHPPRSLYDGSWTEWAGRGDLPIEKG
jgi:thiosulfate/3-mercaptopyruvate sulfurtransferase